MATGSLGATSTASGPAPSWGSVLGGLVHGQDQPADAISWAMGQILAGDATSAQLAGFVVALRSKGETMDELAGMADTMLAFATPIEISGLAVDVVGSGGDRANTVNVSTMAAVVAAAAGARVVKHGNRSASSACGAADVLEELGVVLDLRPERQQQVVDAVGVCFLFAPQYHPALRHASVPRRELGIPTTFNLLGPLANPARPQAQAVGLADARMAPLVAGVLAGRGNQGLVFCGADGLDELTTTTTSTLFRFADGEVSRAELDPAELGIRRADPVDLVGGDAKVNAHVVREVVAGARGPVRDIVLLNAAAALTAFEGPAPVHRLTEQLGTQLERAAAAVDSGAAERTLEAWVETTHRLR
ncbi:MAG: anthranilate phosphoribosyltransferase [Propionibacteriaceae bacterium]